MSIATLRPIHALMLACLGCAALQAYAQDPHQLSKLETAPVSAKPDTATTDVTDVQTKPDRRPYRYRHARRDNGLVSIGHDAHLPSGNKAASVVSILGSATTEGEVEDGVVSILGNSRVTGPVGDAVVAILGKVYIDSKIGGDAVSILGGVELGPKAEVEGNVVVIGGELTRAPTASIHGTVDRIAGRVAPKFDWLDAWIDNCLFYGRPLALQPGLGWAWTLAFGFLTFYVLLALMFRDSVDKCVQTLETHRGRTTVASILAFMLTPIAFVVLCLTVIGILLVPFLWLALMCAGLFGKAVVLAALGRRVTRFFGDGPQAHTAVAVLVGGLIAMALYLVPVVGFIVYKLLGILGLGVVVYTLILAAKAAKRERNGNAVPPPVSPQPAAGPAPSAETSSSFAETNDNASTANSTEPPAAQPAAQADSAQPSIVPTALPYAGFWIRMGALFIDVLLIGFLLGVVSFLRESFLLVLAVYGAIMWKLRGTTIGGIVCGLQVVRFDGQPLTWVTVIVRALGCFLSLAGLGLGFFWIAFDDQRQGWHDKIAGTLVVRAPKGTSLV